MNREQILKRMQEMREELNQDNANIDALEKEYNELKKHLRAAELREKAMQDIQTGAEARKVDAIGQTVETAQHSEAEQRGRALLEKRAVTVAASKIVTPSYTASEIKPAFNEISSLIDMVHTVNIHGGEAYSQPYIKGYGNGDYTAEGADYADAEPVFGYAEIGKAKITAYAEDTEEIQKLPAADYDAIVQDGISKAMRKKITREIMVGDGAAGHFTGIFHNPATEKQVIDPATDIELTEIGVDTLDDIVFSYGGDEDVEGAAVLILSKKDLRAFAKLRGTDKKKLHEIHTNGNTGTIDGVPFIINSACGAVSDSTTGAGTYCMAYGSLSNYQKVIFSDVDIQVSQHYKFKQGNIAHRGSVMMGGNVVVHNGFVRVKKKGE